MLITPAVSEISSPSAAKSNGVDTATAATKKSAMKLSFMLATPIILGAGILKIPDLFTPVALPHLPVYLAGGVAAGIAAFLSVAYLMRYFRVGRLDPFAYYCAGFGILSLILLSR